MPSLGTIMVTKIMGIIGFNCQFILLKIELIMNSSHNTCIHKIVRFSQSKEVVKKIFPNMFYSIQVGEEPNSVFFKKKNKGVRTKSR